jgi:cobaltochelatase CobN
MPARRRPLVLLLALVLCVAGASAQQGKARPRIGFIGVWDRAEPTLDATARELGFDVVFWHPGELPAVADLRSTLQQTDLVFVLNVGAEEATFLRDVVRQVASAKPSLKFIPLDTRGSHAGLERAQLLTADEEVPRYWRANGAVNIRRLFQYAAVKYLGRPGTIEAAVIVPDFGYYDPARDDSIETFDAYRDFKRARHRWIEGAPVAALIIQQSFWVTHDTKVVDAQVSALERHGINPVVIFADRENMTRDLLRAAHPHLIVEDRHGSMWDSRALLEELDAPYLRPISMMASTIDEWRKNPAGLASRDVGMFMTLQESWGTIEPIVVGGMVVNISGFQMHEPVPDGVEKFARRAASWIRLRQTTNARKKLAIVYYNKSLGKGDLMRGSPTGAFLDGPESLIRTLPRLQARGYALDHVPQTAEALIERIRDGARNVAPWAAADLDDMVAKGNPVLLPVSTYLKWFNSRLTPAGRQAVIKAFGPPPGKFMTVERGGRKFFVIPRIQLGNVLLAPQPERGESQDDSLLHSRDVPPPHNYLAFYWWLEEEFKADAVVHWGTHGSLELLPGKEAGLTRDSWSDIAVGDMPVVNVWVMDNIAEATLSRRRSYAVLSDHLPPPAMNAGLPEALRNLHDDASKFRVLESGPLKDEYRKKIVETARAEHLDTLLKLDASQLSGDAGVLAVDDYVQRLSEEQTPLTLHVLGQRMAAGDQPAYLVSILGSPFLRHLAAAAGEDPDAPIDSERRAQLRQRGEALVRAALFDEGDESGLLSEDLRKDLANGRDILRRLNDTDQEITGFLRALDGRYMTPGPGPDPIRNPESAPGGRNLYSLNPEEIPTKASWEMGMKLVNELLRVRHPKKVGMDLNGMDTMRDFGVMEAEILYLMGVRPVWDQNNLAVGVELIPRAELKRPRVDVFVAMGGQYKENFPTRVELLDKAVRLAATADEADNYVRLGTLENVRQLQRKGLSAAQAEELAPARIFGTKQGNMSGSNILYLIPRSGVWDKGADVSSVYIDSMSWVYTKGAWGQKIDGLYDQAIQGTEVVVRNWSSNMTSQLSNHHAYEYLGGLSMAVKALTGKEPEAFIADVRNADGVRMREFNEVLATSYRTELLNDKWIAGMKEHGYAGAGHAAELVKNTFGWSVTRDGAVTDQTWNDIHAVYVQDRYKLGVRQWMDNDNPHAFQEIAATMLEAARKGYWAADAQTVSDLASAYQQSVARHGESNGLVTGGNRQLESFLRTRTGRPTMTPGSAPGTLRPTSGAPAPAASAASSVQPPPASLPRAAVRPKAADIVGRVMAPVTSALRRTTAGQVAIAGALTLIVAGAVFGLFAAGFVRRQGAV